MLNYPYFIIEKEEVSEYYFEVENELLYCVSFKKSFWFFLDYSYEINIQNSLKLSDSGIFDYKLMPTVLEIIKHFLSQNNKNLRLILGFKLLLQKARMGFNLNSPECNSGLVVQ